MAKVLQVGKDLVHKAFKELELRPHRLDRYKASDDPDFEQKAADIIGLYLNPSRTHTQSRLSRITMPAKSTLCRLSNSARPNLW